MSPSLSVGRGAGIAAAAVGVVAAGVAAGVAAEHYAVRRIRLRPDPDAGEPFGKLPADRTLTVTADDGVPLYVEEVGPADAPLTVVFVHGWVLDMGSWHFQRRGLADGQTRLVFYDQRSHGRSGRSPSDHSNIDQLGRDLFCVLQAVAPRGRVVLVGQSMGGMTIMALAMDHPDLFGKRIVGVCLMSTSAGALAGVTFGLPTAVAKGLRRVAPSALQAARRRVELVERTRALGSDLQFLLTRWYAFGGTVSASVVQYLERMIAATSVEAIADFYQALMTHDKLAALPALRGVETLILVGEADKMTPADHSRSIAEALPEAELAVVPGAGHMVMMERPAIVNFHLRGLLRRARARGYGRPVQTRA